MRFEDRTLPLKVLCACALQASYDRFSKLSLNVGASGARRAARDRNRDTEISEYNQL